MTQKIVKATAEKKVDVKTELRKDILAAIVGSTAFDAFEDVVVAELSGSEILIRTKEHDVVLKAVVKKERVEVEFEA